MTASDRRAEQAATRTWREVAWIAERLAQRAMQQERAVDLADDAVVALHPQSVAV